MKLNAVSRRSGSAGGNEAQAGVPEEEAWNGSRPTGRIHPEALNVKLTPRELEVLSLLCHGMSNKAIGRKLGIALATVKVHVGNILRALDVSTRLEAVLLARCWDLVHDGSAHVQRRPDANRPKRR
jgi:DNA-binding NarL/FixJ family response regulator